MQINKSMICLDEINQREISMEDELFPLEENLQTKHEALE